MEDPNISPYGVSMRRSATPRKQALLDAMLAGKSPYEAAKEIGVSEATVRSWKKRDKDFAAEMEQVISGAYEHLHHAEAARTREWESFVEFRKHFFGHNTPYHQARIIQAIEETEPGDFTMVLVPPEHGKTTVFEDWACFKLSIDPQWRFMVGCEAQSLSKRILARIRNRMGKEGPFRPWVEAFGPFAPQKGEDNDNSQVWNADHFNVYKRRDYDERDYSMVALGFGSNVIGSRTDHLHLDDIQSRKTITRTEDMFLTLKQDWLTRPGESGITTMNGTRAGDGDIYEACMTQWEGEPWFRVVKLPAIIHDNLTGERRPLWQLDPDSKMKNKGYTLEMLDKIKRKVGDEVWSRSYMQNPRADGLGTWTRDIIERCYNYERELYGKLPEEFAPIYIGLDPALGGINCIMAWQITSEKMYLVDIQKATNLARNEDIMLQLEIVLARLKQRGGRVTEVVIEAKNFQRGLSRDDRLRDIANKWGFSVREHMTGINKYDEDIGVASMPTSFIQREIDIPYAPEATTRQVADRFTDELLRWRPGIRGALLRQDEVMALWFAWIKWQERRKSTIETKEGSFQAAGLPWRETSAGLIIPNGASPFKSRVA